MSRIRATAAPGLALLACAAPLSAQGVVERSAVHARAALPEGAAPAGGGTGPVSASGPAAAGRAAATDALVTATHRLRLPPETAAVPVRGLRFGGVRLAEITARVDGREAPVEMPAPSGRLYAGRVILARPGPRPPTQEAERAGAGGDTAAVTLRLRYRVVGAAAGGFDPAFDVMIPVLRVELDPASAEPGTFTAEVHLPAGARVTEHFPTVPLERVPAAEAGGGAGRGPAGPGREKVAAHHLSLPVIPALLRFRGRVGDVPFLTLGRSVDLAVAALFVLLGILGWGVLRREERGGGEPVGRPAGAGSGEAAG